MHPLEASLALSADAACARCGPECRFAREIRGWPDFVWCTLRGMPRSTQSTVDCPFFSSPPATTPSDDASAAAPRLDRG